MPFMLANTGEWKEWAETKLLSYYPYNQGFLPSSKRNLLPTQSKIKAEHMPYTQGYFIIQKIPFHFFRVVVVVTVVVVVIEAVVVVCFVYTHFDRHLLEGIEYFSTNQSNRCIRRLCVCGIVYLQLYRLSLQMVSFVYIGIYCGEMCKQPAHAHNLPKLFLINIEISSNAVYYSSQFW